MLIITLNSSHIDKCKLHKILLEDGYIDYYPSGLPTSEYDGLELDNRLHLGLEFESMHGLHLYDNNARQRDPLLNLFTSIDPLCEKYPWISPYAVCANNPLKYADYNGMDWYSDSEGVKQYNPDLTKDNFSQLLTEGQSYIGESYQVYNNIGTIIEDYRNDGSIMFTNETNAYNRMWSQATEKGIEQSGYALKDGKVLVMPDYKNGDREVNIFKYNYSISENSILSNKTGESFKIIGNIHTHQDPSGDPTPSFWTGNSWGDVGHSKKIGGLPVIVIGHDGNVHGTYYSIKYKGYQSITGLGSRSDLLSGKTKLTPWLKTYPTKNQ